MTKRMPESSAAASHAQQTQETTIRHQHSDAAGTQVRCETDTNKDKDLHNRAARLHPSRQPIMLDGKQARHYYIQQTDHSQQAEQAALSQPTLAAHFYGGNGFAVGVYQPLLSQLAQHMAVSSLAMRGCWQDKPTETVSTRQQDAEALIRYLEQSHSQPVIGIGHSQGATATAMAAAMRPELFSQLFLIEPVTFSKWQAKLYEVIPRAIKMRAEPFKSTLTKPNHWDSIDAYYQHLRQHRAYKRVTDEHLYTYAANSLQPTADGKFALIFPPEQELANYFGTPYIDPALQQLGRIGLPYQLIIGKPSMFVSDRVRHGWQQFVPPSRIHVLPEYGHLLPMEAPEQVATMIVAMLGIDKEVLRSADGGE